MGYTGINLESVKNNNRSAILKLLNDQRAMSRKDIAAVLGLTPATVSVICADLISAGILCELGELQEGKRVGRKKMLIGINYNRYHVLSISIESSETCISVTNMLGEKGISRRIRTDNAVSAEVFLRRVADECKVLLWETGVQKEALLGVGVSVPGLVNREKGISEYAYRIWSEPVRIRACLQEYLDCPIVVENNVRAFAEAELIFGTGKDQENMLFVKWGPGVGSSIVIHKQIYESNRSQNAEIGHFIMDPNGRRCRCGRRGCLETLVGTHAMAELLRKTCTQETMPGLYDRVGGDVSAITAQSFNDCLLANDDAMWQVLEGNVEMLARSVSNVITMLAPDRVIVYGRLFEQEQLMKCFMNCCRQIDERYSEDYIIRSELSQKIDYIGPLAVVVNELFLSGAAEQGTGEVN